MARSVDAGGAGPSSAAAGGSRPGGQRDAVDTAGNRQQKGGAGGARGVGAAGFRGLVAERPDLQRMGAGGGPKEAGGASDENGGTESDFKELDDWPAATPKDAEPEIADDVVQKVRAFGRENAAPLTRPCARLESSLVVNLLPAFPSDRATGGEKLVL